MFLCHSVALRAVSNSRETEFARENHEPQTVRVARLRARTVRRGPPCARTSAASDCGVQRLEGARIPQSKTKDHERCAHGGVEGGRGAEAAALRDVPHRLQQAAHLEERAVDRTGARANTARHRHPYTP